MNEDERLLQYLADAERLFSRALGEAEDEDTAKVLRSMRQRVVSLARILKERESSPEWRARLRDLRETQARLKQVKQ